MARSAMPDAKRTGTREAGQDEHERSERIDAAPPRVSHGRMKLIALVLALAACAGSAGTAAPASPAKKFAMRSYTFVLVKRGPTWTADETPESKKIFEGHMANIQAMGKAGKLILAGPLDAPADDKTAYAGLFVLDVKSDD